MRIGVLSDLHLEFGPWAGDMGTGDVLILSGDILVAAHLSLADSLRDSKHVTPEQLESVTRRAQWADDFFALACSRYRHVVYVAGNHEHYGINVAYTLAVIERRYSVKHPNLHILEKESFLLDGVLFYGATLWTNFNNGDKGTMEAAQGYMNDYQKIWIDDSLLGDARNIHPRDVYEDHLDAVQGLKETIEDCAENNIKLVVLSHHAPSQRSCHPRYAGQWEINGAYNSNLEDLMGGPIVLWTHGHTHDSYDYTVRGTRIVCNPRGYVGHHVNRKFVSNLEVEV